MRRRLELAHGCGLFVIQPARRNGEPQNGMARKLVYAGRLAPEKHLPLLVETMARLGLEYSLAVAGEGPQRPALKRDCAARLPGRVKQ